jgi:broad specificity phosphatase PhoE
VRYLEVRRHSQRVKPGQHLSQWGVSLARRVGDGRGPFARVVTSPRPRCIETAVAMGFAVDEEHMQLAGPDGLGETFPEMERVDWAAGYAGMARLVRAGGALAQFAAAQAALWRAIAAALPEEECALVVGHGGAFLCGAVVACVPHLEYDAWGSGSGYCEGAFLHFDDGQFVQAELLRVEQDPPP